MAGIIVYIPFSVISFIGSVESLDGIFIPSLVFSTNEIPISPPTSENRFTNVRLSVRVGGLMSFPFEYRGRIKLDANRITDSGFYYADGQSSNVDNHIGPFLNFKADQGYIQFVSDIFSGSVYVRSYILSGSSMKWTDWHSIF